MYNGSHDHPLGVPWLQLGGLAALLPVALLRLPLRLCLLPLYTLPGANLVDVAVEMVLLVLEVAQSTRGIVWNDLALAVADLVLGKGHIRPASHDLRKLDLFPISGIPTTVCV